MIEPGILDVCLLASEADNPKSKSAWNLAVDPTPYLDSPPEVLLEAMRKSGTPFRSVKCHKTPLVFPTGWEFLRHAAKTDAPDPATIDARSKMVLEHPTFRANVAEALRMKVADYEAPEHLEQKIYSGFPSWTDKTRMQKFHEAPTWAQRLVIAREFDKVELQQLAVRLIWANAPEVLSDAHREAIDTAVRETRLSMNTDAPWTTLGKFYKELEEWEEKLPGDEELVIIRQWVEETYPINPVTQEATPQEPHYLDGVD
jgi:exodeoxyribonuclease-1